MATKKKYIKPLTRDIIMIFFGIVFALLLSQLGVIDKAVYLFKDYYVVAAFIAGIFFTSIFTIAPSSITLVHLSQNAPIGGVVFWGALGAMCGDFVLFLFVKDRFTEDLKKVFKPSTVKFFLKSLHFGFMKWLSPLIGALIIASPLPDEFGITLLGMSKIKTSILLPITFLMNMLGIWLLIQFSRFL